MPDQPTEDAPVVESEVQPGAEPEPTTPEVETETPAEDPDASLPDWARQKLTKANGEAAAYRTQLRAAEAKLSTAKTVEEFESATKDLQAQIHELTRQRIAAEHGLPPALAERLKGSSEEELIADALALAPFAGSKPAPKTGPLRGGLDPSEDNPLAGLGPAELAARYGRASSFQLPS